MLTDIIIRRIESLGYFVKMFRLNGTVEIHAVAKSGDVQVARCNDGEDDASACRAAWLLAEAVGIDLED